MTPAAAHDDIDAIVDAQYSIQLLQQGLQKLLQVKRRDAAAHNEHIFCRLEFAFRITASKTWMTAEQTPCLFLDGRFGDLSRCLRFRHVFLCGADRRRVNLLRTYPISRSLERLSDSRIGHAEGKRSAIGITLKPRHLSAFEGTCFRSSPLWLGVQTHAWFDGARRWPGNCTVMVIILC